MEDAMIKRYRLTSSHVDGCVLESWVKVERIEEVEEIVVEWMTVERDGRGRWRRASMGRGIFV